MATTVQGHEQFGRAARCVVESWIPLPASGGGSGGSGGRKQAKQADVSNLRFAFKWTKSWKPQPNVGHVTIYNTSQATQNDIQGTGIKVTVSAGYGQVLQTMGTIRGRALHSGEPPETVTKIEGQDGRQAIREAQFNKTYNSKVPVIQIVNDLAGSMGLPFTGPSQKLLAQALGDKRLRSGFASNGLAWQEMRGLVLQYGLAPSVQDDQILLLKRDGEEGFQALEEVVVVDSSSGMIGSPSYKSPPHPGKPQLMDIKFFFNGLVGVGKKIFLNAKRVKGFFKVWVCEHEGDTHGGNWYTRVEAQALKAGK